MDDTAPTAAASARHFALRPTLDEPLALSPELGRLAAGLSLSALYGLSLGAREGGAALIRNALGVPLGLVALCAILLPSLTVLFAIVDAPIPATRVLAALGRSLSAVGLVLAGLAPGAALLCVSIESADVAKTVAAVGFSLAGGLGLAQLVASLGGALARGDKEVAHKGYLLLAGYCVFAILLAARLVSLFVPMLGGAA
ncbi:MAG TPA: hypothetical protein VFZ53_28080 [Polyangiaceae bacterium]